MLVIEKDSFAKIHGDNRVADYFFKATLNGKENIYIAEVRKYLLSNLFLHNNGDHVLLIRNQEITYFVEQDEVGDYLKMFEEVESLIEEFNSRIIN